VIKTSDMQAALSSYVLTATADSTYLAKSGGTMTGSLNFGGFVASNLASPNSGSDAATKNYVDNAINGLSWKTACRVATTANITLSGTQTIDGVAVSAGDRVLVKNQTTTTQNGIYVAASGSWTRATDSDSASEIDGTAVYVLLGTTLADTAWTETATVTTIGTSPIVYAQIGAGVAYLAGASLTLTGNTFALSATPDIGAATGTSLVLGSGNTVTISGGNITARGQIFSDRITTVAYVLSSNGANYGHLYVYSTTQWALGYGASTSTLGTAALIWGPNGIEIVAGLKTKLATKTANYSVLVSDYYLRGDATSGAITLTLPTAVGFSGQTHIIKKIDSSANAVIIATTSSQTIDGATTLSLLTQYNSVTLVSNGTNWDVI
jgi:hypothetical protein